MLDKVEPPSIPEGYAMSVAFSALLDLVRGITSMIERELATEEEAAAEFREAHPDQEWQPQPGENGRGGGLVLNLVHYENQDNLVLIMQ